MQSLRAMKYAEQYRAGLLKAIESIDLDGVAKAIEVFREARAHGNCIFVCGSGSGAGAAAHLLCDMVKGSTLNRSVRFRILELSGELPKGSAADDYLVSDRVFVDQLQNIAEHGDVVIGISPSGNSASVLRAFEYASRTGCRTISITGKEGGKLAAKSDIAILVPASQSGSVEDALMIICHMIGYYFVNFDKG